MSIIVTERGKQPRRIDPSDFEDEGALQSIIHDSPETIPLYEIKDDVKLLVLAREYQTESGPIDAIGTDGDGEVYIIEAKLFKNPDRRNVVAQALDYGASLWRHGSNFAEFTSALDGSVREKFGVGLREKLADFYALDESGVDALLSAMSRNLNDGRFKFVIPMDRLSDRLKDLIVFLNQNSNFDVYAVELEYYKLDERVIWIQRLFGGEVKKTVSEQPQEPWGLEKFFRSIAETFGDGSVELGAVRKLYDFSEASADHIDWGRGRFVGSFAVKFDRICQRSLFHVKSDGRLSLNFGWLNSTKEAEAYRDRFKELLTKHVPELDVPANYQSRYVEAEAEDWAPLVDKFMAAVQELVRG